MNKYKFDDLVSIMDKLRGEGGCPWDAEQTHESLKKNMIEEAYEALEAIDSGDGAKMADELGDLLLQIVFHAQIGKDQGEFDIDDVTHAVCTKMIRRHPHVFGDVKVRNSDDVIVNWDEIKKKENSHTTVTETLEGVSNYLPALMRAQKVQSKASKAGFDWQDDGSGAIAKIYEEARELEIALKEGSNIEEELGDLLFSVVNASRFAKINPEEALSGTINKFIMRFSYIENKVLDSGKKLEEMSLTDLDELWNQSKKDKKEGI